MLRAAGLSQGQSCSPCAISPPRPSTARCPRWPLIRRLPDEEIIERLSRVRGIGTWTAEMLLIFRLGRPDVFPVTDYGIRKGYLLTFGKTKAGKPITADMLPKPEEMLRRAATLEAMALGGQLVSVAGLRAARADATLPGAKSQLS